MSKTREGRPEFWRQLIAKQQQSGVSVRALCQEHGTSEYSFYTVAETTGKLKCNRKRSSRKEKIQKSPTFMRLPTLCADTAYGAGPDSNRCRSLRSEAGPSGRLHLEELDRAHALCGESGLIDRHDHTERALRCFAVGRANWTFFGSDRGGSTAAVLRSFVTSCELMKIGPFAWFRDVLSRIAEFPLTGLDELLPHRWAAASTK
jgi:hypothetical protein